MPSGHLEKEAARGIPKLLYNARMVHRQSAHPEVGNSSWRSTSQGIAQARRRTMYTVGMLNRVAARIISAGSEDYVVYQTPSRMGARTYLDGNSAMTMGLVTTYCCRKCHETKRAIGLLRRHKYGPWGPQDAWGALRQLQLLRHRQAERGQRELRYSLDEGTFHDQAIAKMEAGMRLAGYDPHTGQRIGEASNPGPYHNPRTGCPGVLPNETICECFCHENSWICFLCSDDDTLREGSATTTRTRRTTGARTTRRSSSTPATYVSARAASAATTRRSAGDDGAAGTRTTEGSASAPATSLRRHAWRAEGASPPLWDARRPMPCLCEEQGADRSHEASTKRRRL